MSKYAEALHKIEEERIQKVQDPEVVSKSFNFRKNVLGISITALIVIMTVYAYGVYSGSKLKQQATPIEVPISSAHQVSNADQNALLLENVEKMMQVTYHEKKIVPLENTQIQPMAKTIVNRDQKVPQVLHSEPYDFYTVQLVAYQQERLAKLEVQKLIHLGYRPILFRDTQLFKISVGKFKMKAQADYELKKIKTKFGDDLYKGAFIRFVRAKKQNVAS